MRAEANCGGGSVSRWVRTEGDVKVHWNLESKLLIGQRRCSCVNVCFKPSRKF
jgi:hypothetical protein